MAKRFPESLVERVRTIPLQRALEGLGFFVSRDGAFQPRKNARTEAVFVTDSAGVHELILTGEKWFDKLENVGGGGAIDLVMHLKGVSFSKAVRLLAKEVLGEAV